MKDIQAHLDKVRSDASECLLLSSLATDGKREVFARMAEHLNALAFELEKTIAATETNGAGASDHKEAVADVTAAHPQQTARPRRMLPWLLVILFCAIAGALIWTNSSAEKYWSLLLSNHEPSPAPQDNSNQVMAILRSDEQAERKLLSEQVTALAGRLDNLERRLDNLKKARAETAEPLNAGSTGAQDKPPDLEIKPSAPEEKPTRTEDSRTSTLEAPAAAKQMDGHPPASSDPLSETADRVGAISPRRAELDPRKPMTGPPGCTQFRSFDPVSGTYTTLDGRRRQCR